MPAAPTPPPTPAAQLAPALFSLARTGNSDVLTVQLEPASLGHVEVQITRAAAGPASVSISVEQSETLMLLLHDQPALQQALRRAGIPAGSPTTFHLAPPVTLAAPVAGPSSTGQALASAGFGPGSDNAPETGTRRRRSHPRQGRSLDAAGAALSIHPGVTAITTWLRAGLDITA